MKYKFTIKISFNHAEENIWIKLQGFSIKQKTHIYASNLRKSRRYFQSLSTIDIPSLASFLKTYQRRENL